MKELVYKIRKYPRISTWLSAIMLSGVWTAVWLIVFFLATWSLGLETGSLAFILAFWLSVVAEILIRKAENTNFNALLSKPLEKKPVADNKDFTPERAAILLLILLVLILLYFLLANQMPDILRIDAPSFSGLQEKNSSGVRAMVDEWYQILSATEVSLPLSVGIFFRAWIYKRSHK